ncbi:MAG: hypothetical protein GY928_33745 [Colwellia sp.]|nr:hypothetical protein [Colwellia sp.]
MIQIKNQPELDELMPQIEALANLAPPQGELHWITRIDDSPDYCRDCAYKVFEWLCEGGETPQFAEHEQYPEVVWIEDKEDMRVGGGGCEASDTGRCCEHCGCKLWVSLTNEGEESELDHFEGDGIKGASDWQDFETMCGNIIQADQYWNPDSRWWSKCKIEKTKQTYQRVLALAIKYLPVPELKEAV